ncbi:MAG: hypothetical protein OK422_04710 [Thaumarchaeota archaeon]|nr:hypothetical protein [Nitrososphaerota archaeon]
MSDLALPKEISSPLEFEGSVIQIRKSLSGLENDNEKFSYMMYYLMGWLVGDAGRNFHPRQLWARFQLDLSRKYKENLALGNFVKGCVLMLGVPCRRIADGPIRKRDFHGLYRWLSYYSPVFAWFHSTCLGLR